MSQLERFDPVSVPPEELQPPRPNDSDCHSGKHWEVTDNITPRNWPQSCSCTSQCCHANVQSQDIAEGTPQNAVFTTCHLLWKNFQKITYSFNDGNPIQRRKIKQCMDIWAPYVNLHFREVASGGMVRISFSQRGFWTYAGQDCNRVDPSQATMNLGGVNPNIPSMEPTEKRCILHEVGHMLGLLHEHQSPARKNILTFKKKVTMKYFKRLCGWEYDHTERQVLRACERNEVSSCSDFDRKSIMLYSIPPKINKQGIYIPDNYVLSDKDKAYIFLHYPRKVPHPEAAEWTVNHALNIAKVTGPKRDEILSRIRELFIQWSTEEHLNDDSDSWFASFVHRIPFVKYLTRA